MAESRGRERNIVWVVVFSIITLGIYSLYWTYKSFQELKDSTGEGIGGILALVIAILFYIIDMFLLASEIEKAHTANGTTSTVTALTGLWFLLPLIGWIVWVVKVQGSLNTLWASKTT